MTKTEVTKVNKPGNRQINHSHTRAWKVQWVEVPTVLHGFVGLHILAVFKPIYKATETHRQTKGPESRNTSALSGSLAYVKVIDMVHRGMVIGHGAMMPTPYHTPNQILIDFRYKYKR